MPPSSPAGFEFDNTCVIIALASDRLRSGGALITVVRHHPDADRELDGLPATERVAIDRALAKLEAFGERLPFPHQSAIRGAPPIRELRPRAGRSRWRAFYARSGHDFVFLAVGPEAQVDPQRFERSVMAAKERLGAIS